MQTNETLRVGDISASFAGETTDTAIYEVFAEYRNTATGGQPGIGAFGFRAENVANNLRAYGGMVGAIEDDATAAREGRMQLVVANDDGEAAQTISGLTGIGLDIQSDTGTMKLGFFGVTPVIQQSPANNSNAIIAALEALGLFV